MLRLYIRSVSSIRISKCIKIGVFSYTLNDMDKYDGCNKVETVVSVSEKRRVKRSRKSYFLIKTGICAVVIGLICLFGLAPVPAFAPVKDVLRSVFCYDFFGRNEFGSIPIISRLGG